MSRWLKPVTLGMALTLLSGCDYVQKTITDFRADVSDFDFFREQPMVIYPNTHVTMDGRPTRIRGIDVCLKHTARSIYGATEDNRPDNGCVTVRPGVGSVVVIYSRDGKDSQETWAVERDDKSVMLRRPNGDLVPEARKSI